MAGLFTTVYAPKYDNGAQYRSCRLIFEGLFDMCGICGIWGEVQEKQVEAMVSAMHHRGPDDRGIYHDSNVCMGMTRLAIIDVSEAAHQPMPNPTRDIWIVYNGEVYNFQGERRILEAKGFRFKSTSDTEVVLCMYEHYGDDFLLRLQGIFALAIYDMRGGPGHERMLLARDHLGVKPLLYSRQAGRLIFASEMKSMLASGLIEREIDPVALRMLLTYGSVYQPRTMLRGVNMLLPAHRMIVEGGRERIERYWSLGIDRYKDLRKKPNHELVLEMEDLLIQTTRMQMVSDVPLGAFLSGGVDSSLLVALMVQAAGHKVKTFSVGFEEEGADIDESEDARRTASFLGADHSHVLVTGEEVRDRILHIASSLDQPTVDGVNSYFVSLAARKAVTVTISGTGGDELFAGYPWFISMVLYYQNRLKEPMVEKFKDQLGQLITYPIFDPLITTRFGGALSSFRTRANFISKYADIFMIFHPTATARLVSDEHKMLAQIGCAPYHDLKPLDELANCSPIERVTSLCLRGYTSNQLLRDIDAVSMAHSLEVRVPFLDPKVVDFSLSLPGEAKLGDLSNLSVLEQSTYCATGAKCILIDGECKYLPEGFDLQPKRGFAMPFGAWLHGPLREVFRDTLSEANIRKSGLLDAKTAMSVRDRFLQGNLNWAQPWLLMMLELWCQQVLDENHNH